MNIQQLMQQAAEACQAARWQQAEKLYRQVLQQQPEHPEALFLLGALACQLGHYQAALPLLVKASQVNPGNAQCFYNIGNACKALGRLNEAGRAFQQAVRIKPDFAEAYNDLGVTCRRLQRLDDAIRCYQQAIHINPRYTDAWYNLGIAQQGKGLFHEAITSYRQALALQADDPGILTNLANVYQDLYQNDAAEAHYRRALALQPDFMEARSNLLFLLSYNVLCGPQEMLDAHREWDRIHGGPRKAATFARKHTPRRKPPLRIGYVSPDFRQHAVSYFFEPILGNHDPSQVEVFCYAEVKNPDAVTQRLQGLAHHWRSSVGLSDAQLAQRIFDDRIDVLVDLAGHTAGHRLGAFAYKPAPVQATYLGYFTTTGLETMDYWISDQILHPDDTCELATETIYRLPRCCLVYQPPVDAPPVAHRDPAQPIVFGSFNQIAKTSPQAVRLWAQVLRAVPNSRLLIKTNQLADPAVRDQLRAQFQQQGIDPQRLILRQRTAAHRDHLATYGEVDIALDTVPRTGGSTTADALWMGVPIVSLAGPRFIQRLSASMLHAVGLEELVAHSEQRYVDTAVSLARDHQRRQQLRAALRQRMAQSPLCNARDLAHALEKAFADMLEKSRHRAEHAP